MSYFSSIRLKDSSAIDAFSRLRVSNPTSAFSSLGQYNSDPLLYEAGNTGTGVAPSHSANTRLTALSCTAGSGTSYIQSYEYIPYQAGKSQMVFIACVIGAAVASAVVDIGIFDASNGIFIRQNGTSGLQFIIRTSTSGSPSDSSVVNQADWNLDKMDGTGPSGITLDPAKDMILVIDAQYLSMGRVRVGFDIAGVINYCHQFIHANVLAVPYMQTLALPVQVLVTATATAGTKTCHFKCASVFSEGGLDDDFAYTFSTPEQAVTAASGVRTHILSLRPKTTFNGIVNRAKLHIEEVDILVTGNNSVLWELCIGSTFSVAPVFGDVNTTHSSSEYSSTPGTVSTHGLVIDSGYVQATTQSKSTSSARVAHRYPTSLNRAGAVHDNGTLSLFVTGIGGTSASRALMHFSELR